MHEGDTEPIPRVTDPGPTSSDGRRRPDRSPDGEPSDPRGRASSRPRHPGGPRRAPGASEDVPDENRDRRGPGPGGTDAPDEDRRSGGHGGGTPGHGHGHGPALPASRRVRTVVAALLVPFALAAVVGTVLLFPFGDPPETQTGGGTPVDGVITATQGGSCGGGVQVGAEPDGAPECLTVTVRMTDGPAPGREIQTIVPLEPSSPRFAVDDEVVLSYGGSDPTQGGSYQLVDFQRDVPLALLAALFAVAVLVLGRWQGLKALVGLGLSFLVLVFFVLPAIVAGESPLLVAICGAGVIMFAVLYLTHGLSARTSTAVLGTMVSLALIGVLGALWAAFAKLTGLDEDTSTLVGLLNAPIDTRGLLLAGVVIGALGVLDDVTVTQTSAVWELRAANPLLTRRELYTSALRIGRDHVASAVNTLVMAYAGASLPLLLFSSLSGVGLGNILTSQSIAQELVRTLVGSIGLVAAVPITTALAAAVATQEPVPDRAPVRAPRPVRPGRAASRTEDEPRTGRGPARPARNGEGADSRRADSRRADDREAAEAPRRRRAPGLGDRPVRPPAAGARDGGSPAARPPDRSPRQVPVHRRAGEPAEKNWFDDDLE